MKILVNKAPTAIALFLLFAMAVSLVALPAANAHDPPWEITSYAYMIAIPDPVGVGQTTYISLWVDLAMPETQEYNDIRRLDYKLTITAPDETVALTKEWAVVPDPTGVVATSFTPDKVGTYTLKFDYAGQIYTWDSTRQERVWTNDTFLPATRTATLTVKEEPLSDPISSYPLPTEYWTRPIEGQNTDWWTISSHWLGGNYLGTHQVFTGFEHWQKNGVAPESPHIMWTKPIEFGGVVGGSSIGVSDAPGATYYSGGSYEGRFNNALIIHGILVYGAPLGHSGSGGGVFAVDLRTGEEIWYRDDLGGLSETGYWTAIEKGQLYNFDTENQHGVGGGILWRIVGSTWLAYDPFSGRWMYNLTNVPSGTEVYTSKGEIVRYVFNYAGRWMALWNFSEAAGTRGGTTGYSWNQWRPNGRNIDTSAAYSWNVTTIPDLSGLSAPVIVAILPGDIILGKSSTIEPTVFRFPRGTPNPYTVWAISDKPESRGQLLWIKNYTAPAADISRQLGPVDPVNRVWTMHEAETMQWLGYSLDDGSLLWGPTEIDFRDMQFFGGGEGAGQRGLTAYGNLYVQGFGGELFCYSTKNGTLLWRYNNTDSGLQTPWGLMPIFIAAVADGKVYAFNNEHSPNSPLYKGYSIYCIDAYTGEEIYTMKGWAGQVGGRGLSTSILAEGFLAYYNYYDNSVYVVGKGPSATTVAASPKVSVHGSSVLVEGMVTDVSPGTNDAVLKMRFANGVPAVADENMSDWMLYVYKQFPRPADAVGVEVVLEVLDPNNNFYEVGRTTSDASGYFGCEFTPAVPGLYKIIASFEGSRAYYGSSAETFINVEDAPAETPPPTPTPAPMTDTYVTGFGIGIIIAIVVVGLLLVLMLRKR